MNPKTQAVLADLREEFETLYSSRLVRLVLFGSQARGDSEPESDIDVLVVLKGEVRAGEEINRTGEVVSRLSLENDVVISCVFMDEFHFTHRNGPLLRNIRKEGIAA